MNAQGVQFVNTKDVFRFREVLTGLEGDFELEHYPYILTYCGIIQNPPKEANKYWKVWLATKGGLVTGICGLYSCYNVDDTAWIGWFGVLPEYRHKGFGCAMMHQMEQKAKEQGYHYIATYMYRDDGPAQWYQNRGFEVWAMTSVDKLRYDEYLGGDYVIRKNIFEKAEVKP